MPKKIMIVDDEAHIIEMIHMRLEAMGYDVIEAHDGVVALEKAKTEKPDLILMDVMMPKMNGHETCLALKKDESTKMIPVIMLTAKAQEGDAAWGLETGANDYVTKPFDPKELMQKIQKQIG